VVPVAKFTASVVDTSAKFATGVNDTGRKFAASVNNTGYKCHWYNNIASKFSTNVRLLPP
jgi:hypothetical protein